MTEHGQPRNPHDNLLPPVPTQMVYAVRGTDRISGDAVETVLEAPSVDAARRIADQKSLDVADVTLMHPLNGAAALKASQNNPNDRFNTPGSVTQLAPDAATAPVAAEAPPAATPVIEAPSLRKAAPRPTESAPAAVAQRPAGFGSPTTNDTRAQRPPIPGSVAAALVLTCLGGLLYFTVLRDQPEGGLRSIFSASPHRAAAVVVTPTDAGPTDVDELIAASQNPVSAPILPRAQRGPGRTAYSTPPTPAAMPPAAKPARIAKPYPAERAEPTAPLVLTGLSRGGSAQRPTAIINGHTLRPGQSIGGHTLIQILEDSVVLESDGHLIGLGLTPPRTAAP